MAFRRCNWFSEASAEVATLRRDAVWWLKFGEVLLLKEDGILPPKQAGGGIVKSFVSRSNRLLVDVSLLVLMLTLDNIFAFDWAMEESKENDITFPLIF